MLGGKRASVKHLKENEKHALSATKSTQLPVRSTEAPHKRTRALGESRITASVSQVLENDRVFCVALDRDPGHRVLTRSGGEREPFSN